MHRFLIVLVTVAALLAGGIGYAVPIPSGQQA
jgi:hypothetical protein